MLENNSPTLIDNKKLNCSHAEGPYSEETAPSSLSNYIVIGGRFTKVVKEVAIVTG